MFKSLKRDIPAGIVVFLVALPLCLGVALASGAPMISGIISGIVGGIIVGFLSNSHTSVSGPAAGLAAVVFSSINQLGSFELFLASVILAGIIQILMGIGKLGFIANYIPNNVIKGLLAAIGIILILKQIPHAIGFDRNPEDDFTFFQKDGENTFSELLSAFNYMTPGPVFISFFSIFILFFWDKTKLKNFYFLPSSLFVVIIGVIANLIFINIIPALAIEDNHLVNIPAININDMHSLINIPTLETFSNIKVLRVAFTIAIIASLETLLNIEAIDKIDPRKRITSPNKELFAQGVGNIFSGILGGIPITSVIVRSSVNIQTNNESKFSTILHGFIMLLSILIFSPFLNLIPLSSLAAILIFIGYKLAKIDIFKSMYAKGWNQFAPFVITILAIVFTDLLKGVVIGLLVSIFYLLLSNFKNPFVKEEDKLHIGDVIKLELPNIVSFFNKASIKETLWSLPPKSKIMIDASNANYIDDDVLEIIDDFRLVVAPEREIKFNIIGVKSHYKRKDYIEFVNVLDRETQQKLQPNEILNLLKIGNQRFVNGKLTEKYQKMQIDATALEQNPMAVLVGCIDSRTSPELLFDAGLGDLLTIRIAGNIISPEVIGSLEIAVKKLGAKLIVVKGHSNCGAVGLSLANNMEENFQSVTLKILKVAKDCGCYPNIKNLDQATLLEKVARANAINSVNEIMIHSNYLLEKIKSKEIGIVSAYHDLSTGVVQFEEML